MHSYVMNRALVVLVVLSVSVLGYTMMVASGELTGTAGMVTISPDVTIRQGNGVNYSFSEVAVISKLELKSASIEIDDNFEIGAVTSGGYLSNELISYNPSSQIRWIGASTDSAAVVSYTIGGLLGETNYEIWVDGVKNRVVSSSIAGVVLYQYSGTWSTHEFVIQKTSAPVSQVQAAFEYTINGNTIYFTDKSYNGAIRWVWNFGDNFGSTSQSPTHDYKRSGVYRVSLTVYDSELRTSTASATIEIVLGPDNPIEQSDGGWNIYLTEKWTLSISAIGIMVSGGIMFITGMYLNLPIITNNGRKILGILMIVFGLYYFIFVDNGWINDWMI